MITSSCFDSDRERFQLSVDQCSMFFLLGGVVKELMCAYGVLVKRETKGEETSLCAGLSAVDLRSPSAINWIGSHHTNPPSFPAFKVIYHTPNTPHEAVLAWRKRERENNGWID